MPHHRYWQRTAEILCAEDANVVGTDLHSEAAINTGKAIEASGGRIHIAPPFDLSAAEACYDLLTHSENIYNGIDVLFNGSARTFFAFMEDATPRLWRDTMIAELDIAFQMCLAVWPALKRRGGGSIIKIGSLAGYRATHTVAIRHL
jgi:NAD(P)-dependent dehydrogenase (short-subunit alcohol dehydrogenase family)